VNTYSSAVHTVQLAQEPWLVVVEYCPALQALQPRLLELVGAVETYWPAVQLVMVVHDAWLVVVE
jgi:hypothetical protein